MKSTIEEGMAVYLPEFIYTGLQAGSDRFAQLQEQHPELVIHDLYHLQKKELLKVRNPGKPLKPADLDSLYNTWAEGKNVTEEGVWVYYPWLNKVIHILDKEEFIELRTNRNHYKIYPKEQQYLRSKSIGIIGLSVGHAVALCIATERLCGKLKLADFDDIELSNLNRIKTGLLNIGVNKCIATAREIAEIDPFIEIICFPEGITDDNLDAFLLEGGKLDILVDECDGIDVKIRCRQQAKLHRIPVVMETSDKGMLDVERYDLEEDRPILHGLLDGISLDNLKHATNEQKIPIILKIADVRRGSLRGKVSMLEVGQSISTWPQLASAVTLGGGVVTDVCRRILLDQYHESGRYYIDLETLAGNKNPKQKSELGANPHKPFKVSELSGALQTLPQKTGFIKPTVSQIEALVKAACLAPSVGNDQPWKWVYDNGQLFLFHDIFRSHSFGDYGQFASYPALGAAYENLMLKSAALGLKTKTVFFPVIDNPRLAAIIRFVGDDSETGTDDIYDASLVKWIEARCTNRNPSSPVEIPADEITALTKAVTSVEGAALHAITDKASILGLGKIIGECDRIKLFNEEGHNDFVQRELRWSKEQAEATRDGIDIRTLGLNGPLMAVLSLIKDAEVAECLKEINGGKTLVDAAMMTANMASMIGVITMPSYSNSDFFYGGIAMERLWLTATQLGYAIYPLISPFHLFPRVVQGNGEGLDAQETEKIKALRQQFLQIVPAADTAGVFMFKIAKAEAPVVKSLRLPLSETLFVLGNS